MDDLDIAFESFNGSACRLEIRSEYKIDDTNEYQEFEKYNKGEIIEGFANQDWIDTIKTMVASGKKIERIRIVPAKNSPYCDYEFHWCYPQNIKAGENINFLKEEIYKKIAKKYIKFYNELKKYIV